MWKQKSAESEVLWVRCRPNRLGRTLPDRWDWERTRVVAESSVVRLRTLWPKLVLTRLTVCLIWHCVVQSHQRGTVGQGRRAT